MNTIYTTDRLISRVLDEQFADRILAFYESGKETFIPKEAKKPDNFYTLSYQTALARCEHNAFLDGSYIRYFISTKENPDLIIGTVSFSQFVQSPYYSCIIGYKFLPEYHKKGYATESIGFLINKLFEFTTVNRIVAYCLPDNDASIRLLERLDFEFECVAGKVIKLSDGFMDHCQYSRISPWCR